VKVHDLGPLTIDLNGHELKPNGPRPTTLLALLTLNANRRVPVDAMIDALWGEGPTSGRVSTLESHISRLRRLLEPGRARGVTPDLLVNDAGGYRLLVDLDDLDSTIFERFADEGRDALATGRADRAVRRFDAALVLWRGRPFAPCSDEPWAEATVARLDELYSQVRERRIDALLTAGHPHTALADLDSMIRDAPFHEHLHAQRMMALTRLGRTEESLSSYRTARATLLDELGIEPGLELRVLHQRILDGDETLPTRSTETTSLIERPPLLPLNQ
jgi:DNA-binding SARP family transcriptional activator